MEELALRNEALVERMPFLYNLISSCLKGNIHQMGSDSATVGKAGTLEELSEEDLDEDNKEESADELDDLDGLVLRKRRDPVSKRANRVKTVSILCSSVAGGLRFRLIYS
jgi:hypothetical protein